MLGLLARYGRDVAGALQIYDADAPGEPRTPYTTRVDRAEIGRLLRSPVALPLGNDLATGKTSLNGVQPKIVLALIDNHWLRVHDGFPSTHILKPEVARHPTMIFDEEYGARFAYGHIIERGRHMIVSGGLGTSVVPARLGVPPEIVRIELGA